MKPGDNHVHTEWSWDTPPGASMEESCARAVELGLPSIAFTEHLDFTVWGEGDGHGSGDAAGPPPGITHREHVMPLDVTGYLADVERCRERFPGLRILSGIETGEPHRFAGSVAGVLGQGPFDRVLGSVHAIVDDGRLVSVDRVLTSATAEEVVRRYFDEVLHLVRGSDVFEVLAHVDYPRRRWPQSLPPYDETAFEEEYRTVLRELATTGRVLEFNTRSPLFSVTLLQWWREEGGTAVSFGSDAHSPWRVGARFDEAVEVAAAAGFAPGRDPFDFWRARAVHVTT